MGRRERAVAAPGRGDSRGTPDPRYPRSRPAARAFLEAQFGEAPFALFYVDVEDDRVRAGRAAARELCERAGLPVLVGDIVGDNYESIADAVRTVTGVDYEPDPYHGEYPVTPAAAEASVELEASAPQPHRDAISGQRRRPPGLADDEDGADGTAARTPDPVGEASRRRSKGRRRW